MAQMTEIRWHGRGGQGAKTAAYLLAEAVMGDDAYIQAFPEYGPERPGDVKHSLADISRAKSLIGYAPTHSIRQGLEHAAEWYVHALA